MGTDSTSQPASALQPPPLSWDFPSQPPRIQTPWVLALPQGCRGGGVAAQSWRASGGPWDPEPVTRRLAFHRISRSEHRCWPGLPATLAWHPLEAGWLLGAARPPVPRAFAPRWASGGRWAGACTWMMSGVGSRRDGGSAGGQIRRKA